MRGRWRACGLSAALLLALGLTSACHARVTRMVERGRYDDAIERAETRKWEVRGASARAYARALVERGRLDDARDLLYRDFRHGQKLESLAMLAELELEMGARGTAAVHFARLMQLDAPRLEGNEAVCQLFRDRARAHLAQSEPIAADQDLRRVYELCGEPSDRVLAEGDRELAARIAPQARERASALRKLDRPIETVPQRRAQRFEAFDEQMSEARAQGWAALATWASQEQAVLEPIEVVSILLDEFDDLGRGELFSPEQIEGWLGEAKVVAMLDSAELSALEEAQRAWLKLRLAPIVATRGESVEGLDEARLEAGSPSSDVPPPLRAARGWKAAALAGEVQTAELLLTTWLKSTLAEASDPLAGGEDDSSAGPITPPTPWWTRVELDGDTVGLLMTVGRLREHRGQAQSALELWKGLAQRGRGENRVLVLDAMWTESRRQLARTEPWRAMVLAEGLEPRRRDLIRAAAETQLAFLALVCSSEASSCRLSDMRGEAERVMSSDWVRARERSMTAQRPARRSSIDACGPGPEVLAGSEDALVSRFLAWRAAASPADLRPELARQAIRELEADLTLGCSARVKVEVLRALVAQFELQRLSELLTQSAVERSSSTLQTRSMIALAVDEPARAWEWMRAAAAESARPELVYREAARLGRAWGDREFELSARTHLGAIDPQARGGSDARALLRVRFEDRFVAPMLRADWVPALDAWAEDFEFYLASVPPARRWGEGRMLARELWSSVPEGGALREEWVAQLEKLVGPVALASLTRSELRSEGRFLMAGMANPQPERALIARATLGGEGQRTAALRQLAKALEVFPASRAGLVQLLVQGGSAIDSEGEAAPLLVRDDLAWRIALGLEVDEAFPH